MTGSAKQSSLSFRGKAGLLRRYAPRNDGVSQTKSLPSVTTAGFHRCEIIRDRTLRNAYQSDGPENGAINAL